MFRGGGEMKQDEMEFFTITDTEIVLSVLFIAGMHIGMYVLIVLHMCGYRF